MDLVKLWVHETFRVFSDKLITYEDKEIFNELLKKEIKDFQNKVEDF